MEKNRFEMEDVYGELRVFEWFEKNSTVYMLERGTNIKTEIERGVYMTPIKFPIDNLDNAKQAAKEILKDKSYDVIM